MRDRSGRDPLMAACVALALAGACDVHDRPATVTVRAPAPVAGPPAHSLEDCPAPHGDSGDAPWDLRGAALCVRSARAHATVRPDSSDPDGLRYTLDFADAAGVRWSRPVTAPEALAFRDDGAVVVVDSKQHATLFDSSGRAAWSVSFPYCGAIEQVAVGRDGAVTFGCGYSLVRLGRDGALAWQKWPFGNHSIRGPWVDARGVVYASGNGRVAALDRDGNVLWRFQPGENRYVHGIGWLHGGDMVFVTSMAEMHSAGPVRFYYETVPTELIEIRRDGTLASRRELEGAPRWPITVPIEPDGAHRAPD